MRQFTEEISVELPQEKTLIVADTQHHVWLIGRDVVAQALHRVVAQVDRAQLVEAVVGKALHRIGEAVAEDQGVGKLGAVGSDDRLSDVAAHVEAVGQRLGVAARKRVDRGLRRRAVIEAGEGDVLGERGREELFIVAAQAEQLARARAHVGIGQRGEGHVRPLLGNAERAAVRREPFRRRTVGHIRAAQAVVVVHL